MRWCDLNPGYKPLWIQDDDHSSLLVDDLGRTKSLQFKSDGLPDEPEGGCEVGLPDPEVDAGGVLTEMTPRRLHEPDKETRHKNHGKERCPVRAQVLALLQMRGEVLEQDAAQLEPVDERVEPVHRYLLRHTLVDGLDRRGPRSLAEHPPLPQQILRPANREQYPFPLVLVPPDLHPAAREQEHVIGLVSLAHEPFPAAEHPWPPPPSQHRPLLGWTT